MKPGQHWLPSLDGCRAVAILFVLLSHLSDSRSWEPVRVLWRFQLGNLGVRVFFVISGFLISTLLLEEFRKYRSISLPRFFFRRGLRILPAFYVFLAAMGLASALGYVSANAGDFLKAGAFVSDYWFTSIVLGHAWSLSVEQQFYLLLPLVLGFFYLKGTVVLAWALLLSAPVFRFLNGDDPGLFHPKYAFHMVWDALAAGVLLALYRDRLTKSRMLGTVLDSRWMNLLPLMLLAVSTLPETGAFFRVLKPSLLNLLAAAILYWVVVRPHTLLGRLLNSAPFRFVGLISYSLYLWQQPFIESGLGIPFPLNIIGAFLLATLSYYLVERPALSARQPLESKWFGARTPSRTSDKH